MMQAAPALDSPSTQMQAHASSVLLRTVVIGLTAFLTVVDLFATQAILPSLTRAYHVTPAADADTPASVAPAVIAARMTPRPLAIRLNMFVISSVTLRLEGAAARRRIDRTAAKRKCRMALELIADCYNSRAHVTFPSRSR